jgi:hypothetical protein
VNDPAIIGQPTGGHLQNETDYRCNSRSPVLVLEPGDVGLGNRKATAIGRRRARPDAADRK